MEIIEKIKYILNKNIYKEYSISNKLCIGCLYTYPAVTTIIEEFPQLDEKEIFDLISKEIFIKEGTWTNFIWGYTACARKINKLLKDGK